MEPLALIRQKSLSGVDVRSLDACTHSHHRKETSAHSGERTHTDRVQKHQEETPKGAGFH